MLLSLGSEFLREKSLGNSAEISLSLMAPCKVGWTPISLAFQQPALPWSKVLGYSDWKNLFLMGKRNKDGNSRRNTTVWASCLLSTLCVQHAYYYRHLREEKTRQLEKCLSQDHKACKWPNWLKTRRGCTDGRGQFLPSSRPLQPWRDHTESCFMDGRLSLRRACGVCWFTWALTSGSILQLLFEVTWGVVNPASVLEKKRSLRMKLLLFCGKGSPIIRYAHPPPCNEL